MFRTVAVLCCAVLPRLALLPATRCLRIFQKRKSEKSRHVVCYIKQKISQDQTYKTLTTRGVRRLFVVNIFHVWVRMFQYAKFDPNPTCAHVILDRKK